MGTEIYTNTYQWTQMALLNIARISRFSSDQTVQAYADEIWKLKKPVL